MAKDSLRAALDDLQMDASSAKDRRYIEAMLRRLGYTETEIRAELDRRAQASVAVPAPQALPQDFGADAAPAGPARDYRLVVPARETAFSFAPANANATDSPFESFERVVESDDDLMDFEVVDPAQGDVLEFTEEPAVTPEEPLPSDEFAAAEPEAFPVEATEPFEEVQAQDFEPAEVESAEFQVQDEAPQAPDEPLRTFGSAQVDTAPRTRVRVKRVRAKNRQEAEAKVAGRDRRIIKSIPVDIVERWGGADEPSQPSRPAKGGR